MLHRELLLEWVNGLPTDAEVGIDDGGLMLRTRDGENWLEIGGVSQKKQTAGNNKFLAGVKAHMNKPIFAHTARIVNAEGEAAALAYLQQFFLNSISAEFFRKQGSK
jgi:hypothetical protein